MHVYGVPRDVAFVSRYGYRRLRASPTDGEAALSDMVVAVHGEPDLVRAALAALAVADAEAPEAPETGPSLDLRTDIGTDLRTWAEAKLHAWPHMPARLGRVAFDPEMNGILLDAPAPLAEQLAALRGRWPERRHFRIAIVNGFGGNLGDMMLGATAWRCALPALREGLPSFSADVLLGPSVSPAAAGLIGREETIGAVLHRGPTLQEFARYDAFFDFSDLIELPRFVEGAHVDWVLWWMGLDPAAVPDAAKRSRLHLATAAQAWARARLAERTGPRIAFVWRASVELRSMPDATAARFARELLDAAPEISLVIDQPLDVDDDRVIRAETDSAENMMALVAECDGLITIDSLAQHVADAAGLPTVLLLASLPPARFPYYPNMAIITPTGVEALPGWGFTKIADAAYEAAREEYARAWDGVSATACWRLLQDRLETRLGRGLQTSGVLVGDAWDFATEAAMPAIPAAGEPFPYDVRHPIDARIDAELARIAGLILAPGHTVLLACGDSHGLALALARLVAPGGTLHVLEPRRLRARKLEVELAAAALETARLHPLLAGPAPIVLDAPDFDPRSECNPADMGNVLATARASAVTLDTLALDTLALSACKLLVLRPPQDSAGALAGATELLKVHRPLVLIGSLPGETLAPIARLLEPLGYRCFSAWATRRGGGVALCIAVPAGAAFELSGFEPVADDPDQRRSCDASA